MFCKPFLKFFAALCVCAAILFFTSWGFCMNKDGPDKGGGQPLSSGPGDSQPQSSSSAAGSPGGPSGGSGRNFPLVGGGAELAMGEDGRIVNTQRRMSTCTICADAVQKAEAHHRRQHPPQPPQDGCCKSCWSCLCRCCGGKETEGDRRPLLGGGEGGAITTQPRAYGSSGARGSIQQEGREDGCCKKCWSFLCCCCGKDEEVAPQPVVAYKGRIRTVIVESQESCGFPGCVLTSAEHQQGQACRSGPPPPSDSGDSDEEPAGEGSGSSGSDNGGNQGSSSSKGDNGEGKEEEDGGGGRRGRRSPCLSFGGGETRSTASLLSRRYDRKLQASSLIALHSALLGASDQAISGLKSLAVKAGGLTRASDQDFSLSLSPKLGRLQGLTKEATVALQGVKTMRPRTAYTTFGFMDGYEANLEKKVRSGRVGLGISFAPKLTGAFAFNRFSGEPRYDKGLSLVQGEGSARVKGSWDGASAAFAYNPNDDGFTVRSSGLYGWGRTKNERHVSFEGGISRAKGSAESFVSGGLVQAGYNIKFGGEHKVTPYAEALIATASWKGYDEKSSFLPCKISQNKERVIERSFGVRYQTPVGHSQELQAWAAYAVGARETSGMSSRPLITDDPFYQFSIPSYKRRSAGAEVGFECRLISTEDIVVALSGTTRFHTFKKLDKQAYSASIQRLF